MKILFLTNNDVTQPLLDDLLKMGQQVFRSEYVDDSILKQSNPELIVSYCYNKLIPKHFIDSVNGNIVNLHISYLPWNRGFSPNYWSFVDDTPKGVTLHYIDEGLDTGKIIAQSLVTLSAEDTFSNTYRILHQSMRALFITAFHQYHLWPGIAFPSPLKGSYHCKKDLFNAVGEAFDWDCKISEHLKNRNGGGKI